MGNGGGWQDNDFSLVFIKWEDMSGKMKMLDRFIPAKGRLGLWEYEV
ncbi:hypothetical protein [Mesobacillus jeotgali]|nr:hypothetical protein [Mesobacillus jeotgali]